MINFDELKFDEKGLIPAIVVDSVSKKVLTLAYMNRESLKISMEKKMTCFFSRSRQELWLKGETSGNYQHIVSITADCDNDALVVEVEPQGPACHKGTFSCFENRIFTNEELQDFSYDGLMSLLDTIEELNTKYSLAIEFAGIFMTRVTGRTTLFKQMFESYESMFGDRFLPVSIRNCIAASESNTTFEPLLTYDKRCAAAQDYIELVNYLGLMDNKHFRELAKYLKGEK